LIRIVVSFQAPVEFKLIGRETGARQILRHRAWVWKLLPLLAPP